MFTSKQFYLDTSDNFGTCYHTVPLEYLFKIFETNPMTGLSTAKVIRKQHLHGRNKFTKPKYDSPIKRVLLNTLRGFSILIWFSAILSLMYYGAIQQIYGETYNQFLEVGIILIFFIILTSILRYFQDFEDRHIINTFNEMVPMYTTVLRNGKKQLILTEELVLGDFVMLKFGDIVPADCRIVRSNDLVANCICIWGDPIPVTLHEDHFHKDILVARNLAFMSSSIESGTALAVVIATGNETMIGRICLLTCGKKPVSMMSRQVSQITSYTWMGIVISVLSLVIVYSTLNWPWKHLFHFIVGLYISYLPFCLGICMYMCLLFASWRLKILNCTVQNLEAIETVGVTTVLCADMMGTVTMNRCRVSDVFFNNKLHAIASIGSNEMDRTFFALCRCMALCNSTVVNHGMNGVPTGSKGMFGDKHYIAHLKFATMFYEHIDNMRENYIKVRDKPINMFSSFSMSVHRVPAERENQKEVHYLLLLKGQADLLLHKCDVALINGHPVPFVEEQRTYYLEIARKLDKRGRKVFGLSEILIKDAPDDLYEDISTLQFYANRTCFLGFVATFDPPRISVIPAVSICREAGIKIVLMTDSRANFAKIIAKEVGVIAPGNETVDDLAERSGLHVWEVDTSLVGAMVVDCRNLIGPRERKEFEDILLKYQDVVLAHITEDQRYLVIDVCRRLNAVVTMVGNCLLDAPAVKHADIGIGKGLSGAMAMKKAADIILSDDNFSSVVSAIKEGRLYFENVRKAIAYMLASKVPQCFGYFFYAAFKVPQPITVEMIILIDIFVGLIPAMTLFTELPEGDLMKQVPKTGESFLIPHSLIFVSLFLVGLCEVAGTVIAYCVTMARSGFMCDKLINKTYVWKLERFNDMNDDYGQEWTFKQRNHLLQSCNTAIVATVIVMQSFNLILCKTVSQNLLDHGFYNYPLNIAFFVMNFCAYLLCTRNLPEFLRLAPVDFCWGYILPISIFMFVFESMRRYFVRRFPNSWLEYETKF